MEYRYRDASEMKDSGVEWIGKIPKAWKVSKLKWYLRVKSGEFLKDIKSEIEKDINIPVIGGNGVMGYSNKANVTEKVLAVGRVGALCGNVHLIDYNCWITDNSLIVCQSNSSVYLEYLFRILKVLNLNSLSTSTAQPLITGETIKKSNFCLPTLKEQEKIANFLDKKTSQFDSIISKKEALIEKLEEAKKSLISEVVTGKVKVVKTADGYDLVKRSSDEMKDSGVEWLGEIPKDWEVKKFKHIFDFEKGLSITKANLEESGIPCINYGEIHSKYNFEIKPSKHKLKYVNKEYLNTNISSLLKYGDFVFCDTSEDLTGCGNFTYLSENEKVFAGYHTIIARANKQIDYRYMAYLFTSDDWRIQIRSRVSGVKVFSITQTILKGTKVVLPSILEQENISGYLDMKCNGIDFIINKTKQQIEKLKGAKQSLISEVVTGKIEILD